jgi:hypothetical protein
VKTIEQVLEEHPTLSANGFDSRRAASFEGTHQERVSEFHSVIEEVNECLDWLSDIRMIKTICYSRGSYGLKHDVENDCGRYISNGAFIMAALMRGYPMRRNDGPNAWFAMSKKDMNRKWHVRNNAA